MNQKIIYIATDGGCKGNGNDDCIASYGYSIMTKIPDILEIQSKLKKYIFKETDSDIKYRQTKDFFKAILDSVKSCNSIDIINKQIDKEKFDIIDGTGLVDNSDKKATNNRGELTAALKGFEFLTEQPMICDKIIWISDSEYTLKSVDIWSRKWKTSPALLEGKENLDLIFKLQKYIDDLRELCNVELIHVRSHKMAPKNESNYILWYLNERADKLCNKSLERF